MSWKAWKTKLIKLFQEAGYLKQVIAEIDMTNFKEYYQIGISPDRAFYEHETSG